MAGLSYCDPYKLHQAQQQEFAKLLAASAQVIENLGMLRRRDDLQRMSQKAQSDTFKIQVVGTFKNGKSTFINSILGEEVLPAYSLPCTAVINEVKYGKEKRAVLHFRDPLPKDLPASIPADTLAHMKKHNMCHVPPMEIPYEKIEDYVVIPMGEDPRQMLLESPYEKVELFWPLMLLQQGVEIIDSPGLNEHATRTRVTTEYLSKADAVLFVMNAQALCSQEEMSFIQNNMIPQGFEDTFFVVNRYDCIPDREKPMIQRFAKLKLANCTTFGEGGIYYLSGLMALRAKQKRDAGLLKASGVPPFEMRLSKYLTGNKGKAKLAQNAKELRRILAEEALLRELPAQKRMLSNSLEDVKARYEEARPKLEALRSQKNQVQSRLHVGIENSRIYIRKLISDYLTQLQETVPGWIEQYEFTGKLGIAPSKQRVQALIDELSDHISRQMELFQLDWQSKKYMPEMENRVKEIFSQVQADVESLLEQMQAIRADVSGSQVKAPQGQSWQRLLSETAMASGELLQMRDTQSLAREVSRRSGRDVGAGVLLGTLSLAAPAVLAAAVIASVLFGWVAGQQGPVKKLRQSMEQELLARISQSAPELTQNLTDQTCAWLQELANSVTDKLEQQIQEADDQLQAIVAEMEQGRENIRARQDALQKTQRDILTLNSRLDGLIMQLVE